jgi:subtilase family serine protease/ribosomal protein L40E
LKNIKRGEEMTTLSGYSAQKRVMCLAIVLCMVVPGLLGIAVGSKDQPIEVQGMWDLVIDAGDADPNNDYFELSELIPSPITGELGVYHMDGNVIVRNGGRLSITNATLDFIQDVNHKYKLTVDDGILVMSNATIMTDVRQLNPYALFGMFVNNSKMELTNHSVIAFPGDLQITDTETYINDSWITSLSPSLDSANYEAPGWLEGFAYSPIINDTEFQSRLQGYYNLQNILDPTGELMDIQNDCPVIRFTNCANITITDSRIDNVYEQTQGGYASSITSVCAPSTLAANNSMINQLIANLSSIDNQWFNITRGSNIMSIDQFDVSALNIRPTWTITSVVVNLVYSTIGYNDVDIIGWQLQGGASSGVITTLQPYQVIRYVNTTLPTVVDTIAEIQNLNAYVRNTELDVGTFFDNISIDQLVLSVTQTDPNPPTCILADNSELTIVNSYVGIDYLNPSYIAGKDNKLRLTTGSHAYLYNMTVSQDDDAIGGYDPYEFENYPVNPFETFDTSQVYYYRWMDVPIVDINNNPVVGANVAATGNYFDPAAQAYVAYANNLASGADQDNRNSDARILAYINSHSDRAVTAANYTQSDLNGRLLLPVITDVINATEMPNGQFVGNYKFTASYFFGGSWFNKTVQRGFATFPDIRPIKNVDALVDASFKPLLTLNTLALPLPDLLPGGITFTPAVPVNPNVGTPITIDGTIENLGSTTAMNFNVIIEDIFPGQPTKIIGTAHSDSLQPGFALVWTIAWTAYPSGQHYIRVTADVNNTVVESNETNNINNPPASIYVMPYTPDFAISTGDISIFPPSGGTSFGNPITINATVNNVGTLNYTNVPVMFYRDNPDWNGDFILDSNASSKLIGTMYVAVNHGAWGSSTTTGIVYTPLSDGTFTYYVWVDPMNVIAELYDDYYDNLASSLPYVVTPRPNLRVTATNITTLDPTPLQGTATTINANINNVGGAAAISPFEVNFYLDDTSVLIGSQIVPSLGANTNLIVAVPWTPSTPGYHTIIVVVDTTGVIQESSEVDNQASKSVTVYSPMLDLIVDNTNSPFYLDGAVAVRGFVLVEQGGDLFINGSLAILQTTNNQFSIRVRETGSLRMNGASLTAANLQTTLYLDDSAWLNITGGSMESGVNVYASGTGVKVNIESATIGGNFDSASGSNVRMVAKNTTFAKALDDVRGASRYDLTAVSTPSIRTYDTASVYVYRWLSVSVLDGQVLSQAYPVAGVVVNLRFALSTPTTWPFNRTGTTNVNGIVSFAALSDIITPSVYPTSFFVGNYMLRATFTRGVFTTFETDNVMLTAYPAMTTAANYPATTVRMWNVLPDLDPPIWVTPTTPGRNEPVSIRTTVTNGGVTAAHDVLIRFKDETTGEIIDDIVAPVISAGGYFNASTTWVFNVLGAHNISVMVDPYGVIAEFSKADNLNHTHINVRGLADLAFPYIYDLYYSPAPYVIGHELTIHAVVHNIGDVAAVGFNVSFYNGTVGANRLIGVENVIGGLAPGATETVSIAWTPRNATLYNITVLIDQWNIVEETNDTNNQITSSIDVLQYSDIYISDLVFDKTSPVENNTVVKVTARVHNLGEAPASSVAVRFYDGAVLTANLIGTSTVNYLPSGIAGDAYVFWTATTTGRQRLHQITAVAAADMYEGVPGMSNMRTENFTAVDTRPDLTLNATDISVLTTEIITNKPFQVNVTVHNIGPKSAQNVTLDLFDGEGFLTLIDDYMANVTVHNFTVIKRDVMAIVNASRLASVPMGVLGNNTSSTELVTCKGVTTDGNHTLMAVVDGGWDVNTIYGWVNEFNEANNRAVTYIDVALPRFTITISSPTTDRVIEPGITLNVAGEIINTALNVPAVGILLTVTLQQGGVNISQTTLTSDSDGIFNGGLSVPIGTRGQVTVLVTATNAPDVPVALQVEPPVHGTPLWIYIVIIVIIVVAVVGGFTAYTYFVGIGKLVECGSCNAFIPDGAHRCPKCGVEFETETAKCSVCSAWIPIDAKKCPECGAEFATGDEEGEGYEVKMRAQYDEMLGKIKVQAGKTLGPKMTDEQFMNWWAAQPTYITFDEWLREEEEMRKMGSKPCQQCGTPNSVTGRVCHKCGTGLKAAEAPKGKMPKEAPAAAAKPTAVPAPATAPKETKKCPNCNMQVDVKEPICPVCGNDFEKKSGTPPQQPQQPAAQQPGQSGEQPRPVVKKIVRTPMPMQRVVVRKPGEEEKKEGDQQQS